MKTIKEAAEEYVDNELTFDCVENGIARRAFKAGALFSQRWIPIQEELPSIGSEVFVLLDYTSYGHGIRKLMADVHFTEKEIAYGGPHALTGSGYLKGLYFSLPSIVKPGIVTHWRKTDIE